MSVLVWHYQAFYYPQAGGPPNFANRSDQPFYSELSLLYNYGALAVQLFWAISGFVFAANYLVRHVTAKQFAISRFARLYPLHFATLLIVAALQAISVSEVGHSQVYPYNDAYHFALNLFFASSWGLEKGFSFNAPIWSVSVEVVIYALFFVSIPIVTRMRLIAPILAMVIAYLVRTYPALTQFSHCAFYFYLGVALFRISVLAKAWSCVIGIALIAAWFRVGYGSLDTFIPWAIPMLLGAALLMTVGIDQFRWPRVFLRRVSWIGESTYSTYLLHIPIIIVTNVLFQSHGIDAKSILGTRLFFVAFIAAVLILARVSYRFFERPMQDLIGRKIRTSPNVVVPSRT
ncbi:Peptidoglycan/LPS O-acetylase OafA/YrhL, contains acyltransferase and SGNH-hydrolase domains [Burkholderia sp. YR290]|nr:Peptidoglycan/LPS O-acetylase OafA/YrhL, contains acyltransferase and SGNH-hydrolase domains [Burkholderia sp. YR290]